MALFQEEEYDPTKHRDVEDWHLPTLSEKILRIGISARQSISLSKTNLLPKSPRRGLKGKKMDDTIEEDEVEEKKLWPRRRKPASCEQSGSVEDDLSQICFLLLSAFDLKLHLSCRQSV